MEYDKIFRRGSKYVENCMYIWDTRKHKLIRAWCKDKIPGVELHTEYMNKCNVLIKNLECRISVLFDMVIQFKEKQKKDKFDQDYSMVKLECFNFQCRYDQYMEGIVCYSKDYVPGKHKCIKCGCEMQTREEYELEIGLMKIGIKFSSQQNPE